MCLALPGQIVELGATAPLPVATVDFGGVRKEICLAFTPGAAVGDWVLVHVGFALRRIDPEAADHARAVLAAGEST